MFKKNTAVTGFPFTLVSKTDGSAITTGTPTGFYLLVGGTQTAIAGAFTHEGNGQWSVNLAAGEINGDIVGLLFTHTSAVPVHFTIKTVTKLVSELQDFAATVITSLLPAALVGGRIDASVGAAAANVITDAAVAADVTIASVTGAVGSVTGNVGGNVVGSVASVTAGVTVTTNNDKAGYGLSAAAVQAIWDVLTSALTTVGSIGKLLVDNINATVSSRATPAQVNTEVDTALADYDAPTFAELDARTDAIDAALVVIDDFLDLEIAAIKAVTDALTSAAAAKLALSAGTIVVGAAAAGTLSTTAMTTNLTEATDDHYNGRIIIWTSGVLINQATDITDYTGATKLLTFTTVTEAPTAADTFIIV